MNENNLEPFWSVGENGTTSIDNYNFMKFLEVNNFFKNKPNENSTFNIIQKDGIFLKIKDEIDIKDFVIDYIESNRLGKNVYNLMTGNLKFFKRDFLSMIRSQKIEILKDTKDVSYLFFKNGVLEITKNKSELKQYKEFDLSIWENQVIKRDYIESDHHSSVFREFIWKISGGFETKNFDDPMYIASVERYNSFQSAIGYLIHSYKSSSDNKAIILNDEMISDEPNGRSGKGIIWNALSNIKKVQSLNGKSFKFDSSFPYQSVKTDCQILVWDDVKPNFQFINLFSVITEGIEITYKGKDTIKLPVEDSPKILITTNYVIKGTGGSHDARKFELELSSFFNANYSPKDYFGHTFFDDWDENEWARFDCYMIECLKKYLANGLMPYKSISLPYKKFEIELGKELFECIKNIEKGVRISSDEFFNQYTQSVSKKWEVKTKTMVTKSIKKYCDFFGLDYDTTKSGNIVKFIIKYRNI